MIALSSPIQMTTSPRRLERERRRSQKHSSEHPCVLVGRNSDPHFDVLTPSTAAFHTLWSDHLCFSHHCAGQWQLLMEPLVHSGCRLHAPPSLLHRDLENICRHPASEYHRRSR